MTEVTYIPRPMMQLLLKPGVVTNKSEKRRHPSYVAVTLLDMFLQNRKLMVYQADDAVAPQAWSGYNEKREEEASVVGSGIVRVLFAY